MKTFMRYLITAVILIAMTWHYVDRPDPPVSGSRITLEQILSVKELHLVRHEYNDLFFLHRRNDPKRTVQAVAQIPVTVTAYLDLKDMTFIRRGDTVEAIVLPKARIHAPVYHLDRMALRDTRTFRIHVGRDLYPQVAEGLKKEVTFRSDSLKKVAIGNHILLQTETEGKAWLEWFLASVGRDDIKVRLIR